MKHEWRKHEKAFYQPKKKPELLTIPAFNFASIRGEGNPNSPEFSECISALYSISYAVKMGLKKAESKPKGYVDYTVYPLEGVWDVKEEVKENGDYVLNKDDLIFNLMIRQPSFVNQELFEEFLTVTKKKKPNPLLEDLKLETITDGKCVQMMHIGSYDDEPVSFAEMEAFAKEQGLKRIDKTHREIYLSDFRRVPTEKLKTVLRFWVE
jgi:hypothetical protein